MATLSEWWRETIGRARTAMRAWSAGPAVVDPYEQVYGHDDSQFAPEEYGDYIATSNAVYACVTLRATTLSGIPLACYRMQGGKKRLVEEGPVVDLMNKVNPFWTMNRLLEMTEISLGLWGKAFWAIERGPTGKGQPQEIWWLRPDRVTVYPDEKNYIRGFSYEPVNGGEPLWFDPDEVVWFRYPNPLDEYGGLAPLAAARLAADLSSAAAKSNKYLFDQGYQYGGVIVPKNGLSLTPEQARELEGNLDRRFKGVDKAHRWGVLRFEVEMRGNTVTPKDAEFLGTLTWSLEEVARAYKVPLDMIGGQRTYENVQAAERAFWYRTMEPESRFIASEIVEQLLPMFGMWPRPSLRVDLVEFNLTKVPILQEAESERWSRASGQIEKGTITINEWRVREGLEPVAWGDVWWAQGTLVPIEDASKPVLPAAAATDEGQVDDDAVRQAGQGQARRQGQRVIEYGGEEHERIWRRFEKRTGKWERKLGEAVAELLRRQQESVLARLKEGERGKRTMEEAAAEPFDVREWIKKFRVELRPTIKDIVDEAGEDALEELGLSLAFDVAQPAVARFVERRAQRFAKEVNETTWEQLRTSLSEGIEAGDGLAAMMERVEDVMGARIRSSAEVIARTEVIGASNGGTLEGWNQSGLKLRKFWLAALDNRTRDSHIEAHNTYQEAPIGLDQDFQVGAGAGPHPGAIGVAEEDINCRCTMGAVVVKDEEAQ